MSGKFMMNGIEYLGGGSGGGGGGNVDDVYVNGTSVLDSNKIAQITSYKEVTQSEYEALPNTKDSDGIAYFIKDATEAEGFPPLIYSTSEREIGVWIDGKPLYEKSFKFQNDTNWTNEKTFNTGVSDIEWGWVEKAVFKDYGVGRFETVPFYQTISGSGATSYMQVDLQISSCNLILRSPSGTTWNTNLNRYLAVTIRYTKTTDTPGSGLWAGNGATAHHYSTEEHIVGTWIDGKPIYEKIFENLNWVIPSGVDWRTVTGVTVPNGNVLITCKMWRTSGNELALYDNLGDAVIRNDQLMIEISNGSLSGVAVTKALLQYTKTTD